MPVARGSNTTTTNIGGDQVTKVSAISSNIFKNVVHTVTTKDETTIISFTVPTGKKFSLVFFQVNTDNPIGTDIRIKIDGTVKLKVYLDTGNDLRSEDFYIGPVDFAVAGEVITVTSEALTKKGEVSAVFVGIEEDA